MNFLITGVGGQGTVLASDVTAWAGMAAGYDVKKSDILGLAVRGGAVVSHIRWGQRIHSPIIPEGCADYLVAFEILEGLRWLNQVRREGTVLINQQEIHPVTVSSGFETYPAKEAVSRAFGRAVERAYPVPGLALAQDLGDPRVLNVVLLGALSALLTVESEKWEETLSQRVPAGSVELNLQAFHRGRQWLRERQRAGNCRDPE